MSFFGPQAGGSSSEDTSRRASTSSGPTDYFAPPQRSSSSSLSSSSSSSLGAGASSAGHPNNDLEKQSQSGGSIPTNNGQGAFMSALGGHGAQHASAMDPPFSLIPPTPRAGPGQSQDNGPEHPWSKLFGKQGGPDATHAAAAQTPAARDEGMHSQFAAQSMPARAMRAKLPFPSMNRQTQTPGRGISGQQRHSSTAMSASASSPNMMGVDLTRFKPILPQQLASLLAQEISGKDDGNNGTLVIDIRPSTLYTAAKIRDSVNVCAPSTLLKRVGVTIDRIEEEMLTSEKDAKRFSLWRNGPRNSDGAHGAQTKSSASQSSPQATTPAVRRIVVLDIDTQSVTEAGRSCSGGGGPCLTGLLRKFDVAGFGGDLLWLIGGYNAFEGIVLEHDKASSNDQEFGRLIVRDGEHSEAQETGSGSNERAKLPHTSHLQDNGRPTSLVHPKGLPMEAFLSSSTTRGQPFNGTNAGRQSSSDQVASNRSSLTASNPFYDTIRQNRELQHGFLEKIPMRIVHMRPGERARLPPFLRRIVELPSDERASLLAKKFFDVEVQERDRLMATMQQHSNSPRVKSDEAQQKALQLSSTNSAVDVDDADDMRPQADGSAVSGKDHASFPFSISASIERGSENRYNNIWTYEHSRVRCPDSKDFFNGSHIQPGRAFGCARRYIATQAPLPATFDTFWSIVWTQNVRTICMVTREFESGRVQSHNYWKPMQYGSFSVELIDEVCLDAAGNPIEQKDDKEEDTQGGSYFGGFDGKDKSADSSSTATTMRRRLSLRHENGQRRLITHMQFIAWPDYSIPDNAASLLTYMRQANRAQMQADLEERATEGQCVGPLVVHCSAGVGRTGTYIVIDIVLDILRRARTAEQSPLATWDDGYVHEGEIIRGRSHSTDSNSSAFDADSPAARRRNLKRELSPGGMDLDATSAKESGRLHDGSAPMVASPLRENVIRSDELRDTDSPPPARRSRSDDDPEESAMTGSPPTRGDRRSSLPGPQFPFGSFSSTDGTQTPSTALGRLSLSAAQGTPVRNRIALQLGEKLNKPSDAKSAESGSPSVPSAEKSLAGNVTPRAEQAQALEAQSARAPLARLASSTSSTDAAVKAVEGNEDLVRQIVETMREQRMSMVQTTRQYVFAYSAILEGVIYELRHSIDAK